MKNIGFLVIGIIMSACSLQNEDIPLYQYLPQENQFMVLRADDYASLQTNIKNNKLIASLLKKEYDFTRVFDSLKGTFDKVYLSFNDFDEKEKKYHTTLISKYKPELFKDTLSLFQMKIKTTQNNEIVEFSTNGYKLYSTIIDDVFVSSTSRKVVDNILIQGNKNVNDSIVQKLYSNPNNSSATLYLNNKVANPLFSSIFVEKKVEPSFNDWFVLDISVLQHKVSLNGIGISHENKKSLQNLFYGVEADENRIVEVIPSHIREFESYSFNDFDKLFDNIGSQQLDTLYRAIFSDIKEIGLVFDKEQKALLMRTESPEKILEMFVRTPVTKDRASFFHDKYGLGNALNPIVKDFSFRYATLVGDFIVFGESNKLIKEIMNAYKTGNTCENNPYFKMMKEDILKSSNILKVRFLENQESIPELYKIAVFQANSYTDYMYINTTLKEISIPKSERQSTGLFNLILDNEVQTRPQFLINHRTKTKDIAVQDKDNVLYLIDAKGEILWKKNISKPIIGDIKQVDLYKNGRLQMVISTANQFLIIDRDGKEVKPFTFKYKSPLTTAVGVLDYNKDRNYRFVVCTKNGKVIMYDRKGKLVDFRYKKSPSQIIHSPKHIRIGKKDYIVIAHKNGSMNILHRKGTTRIKVDKKISFSGNEIYLYKNRITTTDKKGRLISINTKGKVSKTPLNLGKKHTIEMTTKTLVTLSENILTIKGKKIELPASSSYTAPKIYYIKDVLYITTSDIEHQKIYVYHSDGRLLARFPIDGMSAVDIADIDNDGVLELVCQSAEDEIRVYPLGL